MAGKKANDYQAILCYMKEHFPNWEPQTVVTDYEAGLRKAFKEVFPDTEIRGCFFHYSQVTKTQKKCTIYTYIKNIYISLDKYRRLYEN